jgi:hypothetical protein
MALLDAGKSRNGKAGVKSRPASSSGTREGAAAGLPAAAPFVVPSRRIVL